MPACGRLVDDRRSSAGLLVDWLFMKYRPQLLYVLVPGALLLAMMILHRHLTGLAPSPPVTVAEDSVLPPAPLPSVTEPTILQSSDGTADPSLSPDASVMVRRPEFDSMEVEPFFSTPGPEPVLSPLARDPNGTDSEPRLR